jgi:Kef-type K+ transport system membrane component KefB
MLETLLSGVPPSLEFRQLLYFTLALFLFLALPRLFERLRLPGLLGLVAAGAVLGPPGLGLIAAEDRVVELFAEIGKLMLMFIIGLEIDLRLFNRVRLKSILFGLLTFLLPFVGAMMVAREFGYGWNSAVLIGSLLASHTLIAFPIIQRLDLAQRESVAVTVGATILTDVLALLTLAVCASIHVSGFAPQRLALQVTEILIYVLVVVVSLGWVARRLIARYRNSDDAITIALLLVMALASIGAALIRLEDIVGAFLAGLAVNSATRLSKPRELISLLGHTLFIPAFFFTIGFQLSLGPMWSQISSHSAIVAGLAGALVAGKYLAADISSRIFGYSREERMLMWSLSLPQVAATLASAFVAFGVKNHVGERLIDVRIVSTILVLMLLTTVVGPMLTLRYGKRVAAEQPASRPIVVAPK